MPINSYRGRYQAPHGTHRRRRRRRQLGGWIVPVLLMVLVCSLAGVAAWATWPSDQPEPPAVLQLPEGIRIAQPVLATGVQPDPMDFVAGLEGSGITVSFEDAPTLRPGRQTVKLRFSRDNAVCYQETSCYLFEMKQTVTVDVSENHVVDTHDFVTDEAAQATFGEQVLPKLDTCGEKTLSILCGGKTYQVRYMVKESVPPTATANYITAEIGTVPDPALLVKDIADDSQVTVNYKTTPELTTAIIYPVTVVLTDAYGNTAEIESQITAVPAANAPKFEGLSDISIQVGDTISYKSGVTATDPQDGSVNFTVDAAAVDRNQEGVYVVFYSAMDSDGNTTIMPRTVSVVNLTRAAVEQYAQAALDKIITAGMTRDQKIFAVYKYTKSNIQFVGSSDKSSVIHGAYEGFTTGKGDCYTYYAMNVVLLDMLGIENLEVRRIGGTSNHWWNLVQYDDGKWYHVDSCPHAVAVDNIFHWKMTETDLATYTADPAVAARRPNFYVYDKTLPEYEGIEIAP